MELQTLQIVIIVSGIILLMVTVLFVGLYTVFQKKKLEYILREREQKEAFNKALALAKIEINELELKNIAWELHDNVGQLLLSATMELNLLIRQAEHCHKDKIKEIQRIIKKSLEEIRSLSKSYNSEVLKSMGLIQSVQNEVDRFNKLNFLRSKLIIEGETYSLPPEHEIILFRIIQESFSNIIKHAYAKNLNVSMDFRPDTLHICIIDDGRGFDTEAVRSGSGIINMRSRAEILGCNLEIHSGGTGTQICIDYPVEQKIAVS